MKLIESKDITYVTLTYDEEVSLARSVYDLLVEKWVQEGFREALDGVYRRKALLGRDLSFDDLERLIEFYELYGVPLPALKHDGKFLGLRRTKNGKKLSLTEQIEDKECTVIHAWYEVWLAHPLKDRNEDYESFPGLERLGLPRPADDLNQIEFDQEVERVRNNMNISETEAIKIVSDYW